MSKLNPIEKAKFIESEFRRYLKSTFSFNEKEYQKIFNHELDNQVLYKGPYIKATLPFQTGNSLRELMEKGKVSSEFQNLDNINLNQKLYLHQQKALQKISDGRNVVITTGTGSGKTESFLYPIINSILREIESGENPRGIRAIFLYPMNALVNDQIDRVRKMLVNYPEIKYGFFTGDTPEKKDIEQYRKELEELNEMKIPTNEILTREQIREEIPHLLFTNYSMLEYLLIRPNDYILFRNDMLDNWRYVVLDEAHIYNGALGIEVAMLLRRVTGMAIKKPQFILTSATLGQRGKSEDEIMEFAKNLTGVSYEKSDIIFSDRVKLDNNNIKYAISPNEYIELEKSINDLSRLKQIGNKYNKIDTQDNNKYLYELLYNDENIYILYNYLTSDKIEFRNIWSQMQNHGFDYSEELIALIHLINIARDDEKILYDMKYHTFIRTLSGGFITLGENKQLRLSQCSYINNFKAFELGNCRYCNTMYILGKIANNNILYQNTDVDIYENYGENNNIRLDYFLLKDSLNLEEVNLEQCTEYIVCSKCGKIHDEKQLNFEDCDCGDKYKVSLLKVESNSINKNNINECPCCRHRSNNGIIRTLSLGKDEATALIGQILYKAIDDNKEGSDIQIEEKNLLSFSFEEPIKATNKDNKEKKQYIAFSDSRQQASFFADFFEYNFKRFLRKRLLWSELEKNKHEPIPLNHLVSNLKIVIENNNLFTDDNLSSEKEAWITILKELLEVDGQYGGEGLGLFYFKLDIEDILNRFPNGAIEKEFGKYNINKDNFLNFVSVVFNGIRRTPAINYDKSTLTIEERNEYFEYRSFENFIKLKKGKETNEQNIKSFLPINNKPNDIVDYTMRVGKCSQEEASIILEKIYNVIGRQCVFSKSQKNVDEVYQIDSEKYSLHSYKTSNYYKCNKCGSLVVYNVNGVCTKKECDGTLLICNPDEILKDNYYRNEYKTKKIEPMLIKEHTAQLTRKMAKEYQQEFKKGNINILSCSTTFEMGVDIGNLENIFLRNVPPTPANYVQRAGRAGRRKDSSAFILTFCNNSSHDYTYFENTNKMIDGVVRPPHFSITNEKIIVRHLLAAALGFFFRKYPSQFENVGTLVCEGGLKNFEEYILSYPEDLNKYINEKILDKDIYNKYCDFKWYEIMKSKNDLINNFADAIKIMISDFEKGIEYAKENEKFEMAHYYKNQIEKIKSERIIDDLSRYGVIPKYGFPVDVVELQIYNNGMINNKYDLNRDLSVAISEYAPESEIIVDKVKYTSRYISLPKKGELRRYYYYECDFCKRVNVIDVPTRIETCQYCNCKNEIKEFDFFIEPIHGFKAGENKKSSRKKPKKTYVGDRIYLGNGNVIEYSYEYNSRVIIETSKDDKLLVINSNPFYMCKTCGYTEIIKNNPSAKINKKEHYNYRGFKCFDNKLNRISLGHMFKTDVAKIIVKNLGDKEIALSTLYALLEGISTAFNIERRDIDGLVVLDKKMDFNLIVYDNVPGGAGHVKRLKDANVLTQAFEAALNKAKQNCCEEDSSCYNCLRNYYNQKQHKHLSRKKAIEGIKHILEEV